MEGQDLVIVGVVGGHAFDNSFQDDALRGVRDGLGHIVDLDAVFLQDGVTIENLLTAEPHGRNQLLAYALKRVGLAEKTGRGIDIIFEGSLIYGRALPDYSATTSSTVSLFIPRCKPDVQLGKMIADEQNRLGRPLPINTLLVLNILKDMPRSDVKQLSEALNLSEILVKTVLDKSKSIGYVRQRDIDETRYAELILNMARSNEFISRADVMNLLHVKDAKAYGLLKKLAEDGRLIPVNKGRYAKYRIK